MKKYLLLASVAGCLMCAGNAMAGTIADDGQSATINISAKIVGVDLITAVQDMNFGTLYVPSNIVADDKIADMDEDGVITLDKALRATGTSQVGYFEVTRDIDFDIVCGSGDNITTDDATDGCSLTGLSGQELSVHVNASELDDNNRVTLSGELYFTSGGSSGVSMDTSGSITVTLNY